MPPEIFLDRSLGGLAIPTFFREVWPATVRHLDEVFGTGKVEDATWMRRCDSEGWIAICKDDRIRTRAGERRLMSRGSLRVFCLANGNLKREEQVARFQANLGGMLRQSEAPGPWLFAVYSRHMKQMKLYE